jgi:hypothetical protein
LSREQRAAVLEARSMGLVLARGTLSLPGIAPGTLTPAGDATIRDGDRELRGSELVRFTLFVRDPLRIGEAFTAHQADMAAGRIDDRVSLGLDHRCLLGGSGPGAGRRAGPFRCSLLRPIRVRGDRERRAVGFDSSRGSLIPSRRDAGHRVVFVFVDVGEFVEIREQ